jgi:transcriptional/translational regulatory protein YebC/TACO1
MLPRTIPCLTGEQWEVLEAALKRGPTPEMRERLKKAIERAKKIKVDVS